MNINLQNKYAVYHLRISVTALSTTVKYGIFDIVRLIRILSHDYQ